MNSFKMFPVVLSLLLLGSGCVSKKKLTEANAALEAHKNLLSRCEERTKELEGQVLDLTRKLELSTNNLKKANEDLSSANMKLKLAEDQLAVMKGSQNSLLEQLNTASVINKAGAESIKKSLEAISQQSSYIKDLTKTMQYKDSVNLALAMNLKKSLSDFNDSDVSIEVKKGVVYISLSDNLLFRTASANINNSAEKVLGKIAGILNDQKDLDILVEGHTDNVPMAGECITDNWDLSTRRATAVVKLLQSKYKVDPARMTAGGRSEYVPKASNSNATGRAANRRTEIIVLPKLDQFFKLMEAPNAPK
ncbi:MAG TPA: flagellar motor protein MotB [Saprospiraceae bacterium]|jgi:chemotaxis protein MotB|nr:flagellar motor protein MotB [Saprospiraceae bacterium]MBK7699559.1 flagellar motor protein MotB [Saprospiraceae bacterium]MBK8825678.1 flagellar motor protein MotB [Saprospiraceae bacterium]MBK8886835.1 flagellar motor protein MotB [Saprospiraceae bacterium]MBK9582812.1 flagellar motor protein MotB [Saprospiraceae bacterium]